MHFLVFCIVSIWLTVVPGDCVGPLTIYVDCPEVDYSPCHCKMVVEEFTKEPITSNFEITCEQVPIAKVKDIFSKTTARHFDWFTLRIAPSETSPIPADLLGSSSSSKIRIESTGTYKLKIDDNAFRSSRNQTDFMAIHVADFVNQSNFAFLRDFQALTYLELSDLKNIKSFQGLPIGINRLNIYDSREWQNLVDGPNIVLPNLERLFFYYSHIDDVVAAKILKTLASSSRDSLSSLSMTGNNLTRIPEIVKSFTKMNSLWLDHNDFTSIDNQNFPLRGSEIFLDLRNNNISSIEPHVFQGDITYLYLDANKMTRFESYVFQPLLESFLPTNPGSVISIKSNAIECDCHLAWLIVHQRHLLRLINGGQCSNSTSFEDLKPEGFKNCPVFTCPTDTNGNFPNPLSSSSYYTCTGGKSTLVECPTGKVFDRFTLKYDWAKTLPTCK